MGYGLHNIQPNSKNELKLPDLYFLAYNNYTEFKNNQAAVYYNDNDYLEKFAEIKSRSNSDINTGEISNFQTEISQSNY